jgi:hypothetical protein
MEEGNEAYLKCNYSEGMFSDTYFVSFKGSEYPRIDDGGVFVVKENVIINDGSSGLVKIMIARKDEKTSQILVPSMTESGTFFKVPNEDITFDKN